MYMINDGFVFKGKMFIISMILKVLFNIYKNYTAIYIKYLNFSF